METMLVALDGMCQGVSRNINKLDTFYLFKTNPFHFKEKNKNLTVPIKLLEERWLLDKFFASNTILP